MEPVRLALIGAGPRGRDWLPVLTQMRHDLALVAVCDLRPAAAEEAAALAGIRAYTNYRELLDKEKPEAAAVIIPEGTRDPVAMDLLDAGVPVITETPIAGTLAQADRQIVLAERRGVKYEVAEQYYRAPRVRIQLALIQAGIFGRVFVSEMEHVGHGYHGMSLIRAYLGMDYRPARVIGFRRKYPVVDHKWLGRYGAPMRSSETWSLAMFEFPGGELGRFTFTTLSYNSPLRFRDPSQTRPIHPPFDAPEPRQSLRAHEQLMQVAGARTTRFYAERGMMAGDEMVVLEGTETRRPIRVTRKTHRVDGMEVLAALEADLSPTVTWENPVRHYPLDDLEITVASEVWAFCRAIRTGSAVEYGPQRARLDQEMMLGNVLSAQAGSLPVTFPLGPEHGDDPIVHY